MDPGNEELLRRLVINDERELEALLGTPLRADGTSGLGERTLALVRLAGLVAVGSEAASYQWGVTTALAAGATEEQVVGVLVALAPIVGRARVSAAAPEVGLALGCDLDTP